jgi:hypothetical protein
MKPYRWPEVQPTQQLATQRALLLPKNQSVRLPSVQRPEATEIRGWASIWLGDWGWGVWCEGGLSRISEQVYLGVVKVEKIG